MGKTAMQDLIEGIECCFFTNVNEILQWAKVHGVNIEKKQIINTFDKGLENWDSVLTAEQYYSQTYTG